MTLFQLNSLAHDDAVAVFLECCAARSWAERMAAARPYADLAELLDNARRSWDDLGPDAWSDAFQGHPRIGEKKSAGGQSERASRWSEGEQSAAEKSDAADRSELAALQADYEARFGHIFLICATGKSASEMLDALKARLENDPTTELRVAAQEQAAITRLRLEKLLDS